MGSFEDYEDGMFSDPVLMYSEGEPRIIDTIFNVSSLTTSGIFNNSLFQYAGIIILGIILFEVALYALDVYYNQTYLNTSSYSQRYDSFDPDSVFQDYPPYPDPFASTYRAKQGWSFNPTKIVEWISLMNDTWEFTESTLTTLDCQKRAVCEIWRPENGFKYTDKMDLFFKYSEMMNLPDGLIDIIDEFSDARQEAFDNSKTCLEMYSDCPSETLIAIMKKFSNKK